MYDLRINPFHLSFAPCHNFYRMKSVRKLTRRIKVLSYEKTRIEVGSNYTQKNVRKIVRNLTV